MSKEAKLRQAKAILVDLDLPKSQQNERTALCLLALLNLTPRRKWSEAEDPAMGITPIMDWARNHYNKNYAPNTRETFRRQSMHQFVQAGIALYNPDRPDRPVNSPNAVYRIAPEVLDVVRQCGTKGYPKALGAFLAIKPTLAQVYAKSRELAMVPLRINGGEIRLSPGTHSSLLKEIIEQFCPRFLPGGEVAYLGDTEEKHGYFDVELLKSLGVELDGHGKLPDVVVYYGERNWLCLIESVTSHGPVDSKRHTELEKLFAGCSAGLVFVSAFPNRKTFLKYMGSIAWETEVWIADAPTHMIHFNGSRFLGPYK